MARVARPPDSSQAVYTTTEYVFENPVLTELCDTLHRTAPKLFKDRNTAEVILIPPFLRAGLLKVPPNLERPLESGEDATGGATDKGKTTGKRYATSGYIVASKAGCIR